ncbi:hypothetical protein TrVE_jg10859 [Triparma verrucosa]|uniref:BHLH domain-containing protein n=2 Tax=Triparma TaxID=722752 RepID=A0A9W6ZS52_9STRA|nr:hypothetical protein TrST_g9724 [Triparma strigata]GMH92932.1 hypothetical protein TrVE_jg10859 [Triparma verrucosa]
MSFDGDMSFLQGSPSLAFLSEIDLQGIEPAPISLPRPAQAQRAGIQHSVSSSMPRTTVNSSYQEDDDDEDVGTYDEKQHKVVKRMEKKKCREKKRRQDVNDKFNELTALLDEISPIEATKKTTNRAELITRSIDVIKKLKNDLDTSFRHKRAKVSESDDVTKTQSPSSAQPETPTPTSAPSNPNPTAAAPDSSGRHPLMIVVPVASKDSGDETSKNAPPACMVYPVPFYNGSYDLPSTTALSGILNVPVTSSGLVEFDEATKPSSLVAENKPLAKITIQKATEAEERKKYIVPGVKKGGAEEPSASPSFAPCA